MFKNMSATQFRITMYLYLKHAYNANIKIFINYPEYRRLEKGWANFIIGEPN